MNLLREYIRELIREQSWEEVENESTGLDSRLDVVCSPRRAAGGSGDGVLRVAGWAADYAREEGLRGGCGREGRSP